MVKSPLKLIMPLLLTAGALAGCGDGHSRHNAVPRPQAYARLQLYDSVYAAVDSLPLHWEMNAATLSSIRRNAPANVWLDIDYPLYQGVANITFIHLPDSAEMARTVANRTERMALNLGGNPAEEYSFATEAGFAVSLLEARAAVPVQFIAVGRQWVVSGTFTFCHAPQSYDSVMPVVRAVTADFIHAARQLRTP